MRVLACRHASETRCQSTTLREDWRWHPILMAVVAVIDDAEGDETSRIGWLQQEPTTCRILQLVQR